MDLLFRAWHKEHNRYYQVVGIEFGFETKVSLSTYIGQENLVVDIVEIDLEQKLALKSTSGEDLYVGDILRITIDYTDVGGRVYTYAKVLEQQLEMYVGFFQMLSNGAEIEVIGNIHEHKYLL